MALIHVFSPNFYHPATGDPEIFLLAMAGIVCGYILGCGIADLIEEWNFHTAILPLWRVIPQVALLNLVVAFVAVAIPLRILRRLEPAALLRGE